MVSGVGGGGVDCIGDCGRKDGRVNERKDGRKEYGIEQCVTVVKMLVTVVILV